MGRMKTTGDIEQAVERALKRAETVLDREQEWRFASWKPSARLLAKDVLALAAALADTERERDQQYAAKWEARKALEAAEARVKTTGDIERERDFWRGRYEVQHRTVHRLEDRIAELAAALADTERERDTEREGHRIAAERTAASREAWQAAEARVAELQARLAVADAYIPARDIEDYRGDADRVASVVRSRG